MKFSKLRYVTFHSECLYLLLRKEIAIFSVSSRSSPLWLLLLPSAILHLISPVEEWLQSSGRRLKTTPGMSATHEPPLSFLPFSLFFLASFRSSWLIPTSATHSPSPAMLTHRFSPLLSPCPLLTRMLCIVTTPCSVFDSPRRGGDYSFEAVDISNITNVYSSTSTFFIGGPVSSSSSTTGSVSGTVSVSGTTASTQIGTAT